MRNSSRLRSYIYGATSILLMSAFSPTSPASSLNCRDLFETPRLQISYVAKSPALDKKSVVRVTVDRTEALAIATTPETRTMIETLLRFAEAHGLDERIVEVGPPSRRLKRLVVALDVKDAKLVRDYMEAFNLQSGLGAQGVKTLSVEVHKELENVDNPYVFVTVRSGSRPGTREGLWRWGRTSVDQTADWFVDHYDEPDTHIVGFAHLIPVLPEEAKNIDYFLNHPEERGPCKSDNCAAWLPSLELGKTSRESTKDERKILFNELGISRSTAHFEIGRRIMHAANDRHVAMIAYYRDEEGLKNFRDPKVDILPPEPDSTFESIIHGFVRSRDTEAAKAMMVIPDGAKVFFPIAAGASPDGMSALVDRSMDLKSGVEVHILVNGISEATLRRGVETTDGKFRIKAHFLGGNARALHREGKVDVIPGYLADFARHVADPEMTDFRYDAIVVRVSPPDSQGRYSLGPNNDMIKTIIRLRPDIKVVAEVNPKIPFTIGDNYLTESEITAKFSSTASLAGPAVLPVDDVDRAIGNNLTALIPDGSTVQLGIGGVFSGLPGAMHEHKRKDIQFFTEMMGDPMRMMIESGVADKAVTGFVFGSKKLYKWLDHNPKVSVMPTEYTNDPSRVASIPNFRAINTALQVNLRGDVNATEGPDGRISSPGGQVEFMSGAVRAPGGKAIIAIRAKHRYKDISMITLDLYHGEKTTPHEMVTHVVTEYGIAALAGKTEAQRALALIRIAHPKYRSELAEQAMQRRLITPAMRAEFKPELKTQPEPAPKPEAKAN